MKTQFSSVRRWCSAQVRQIKNNCHSSSLVYIGRIQNPSPNVPTLTVDHHLLFTDQKKDKGYVWCSAFLVVTISPESEKCQEISEFAFLIAHAGCRVKQPVESWGPNYISIDASQRAPQEPTHFTQSSITELRAIIMLVCTHFLVLPRSGQLSQFFMVTLTKDST